jgi:hypothetical protein
LVSNFPNLAILVGKKMEKMVQIQKECNFLKKNPKTLKSQIQKNKGYF